MRIPKSRPASRGKWKTLAPVARDFSWKCRPAARENFLKKHPFEPIICTTFKWGFSLPGFWARNLVRYSIGKGSPTHPCSSDEDLTPHLLTWQGSLEFSLSSLFYFRLTHVELMGSLKKYWQYSQGDLTWGMYYCTYWVQWLWIFVILGTRCCTL